MLQSRENTLKEKRTNFPLVYGLEGNINYPNLVIKTSGILHTMLSVVNDDAVVVCILFPQFI